MEGCPPYWLAQPVVHKGSCRLICLALFYSLFLIFLAVCSKHFLSRKIQFGTYKSYSAGRLKTVSGQNKECCCLVSRSRKCNCLRSILLKPRTTALINSRFPISLQLTALCFLRIIPAICRLHFLYLQLLCPFCTLQLYFFLPVLHVLIILPTLPCQLLGVLKGPSANVELKFQPNT